MRYQKTPEEMLQAVLDELPEEPFEYIYGWALEGMRDYYTKHPVDLEDEYYRLFVAPLEDA